MAAPDPRVENKQKKRAASGENMLQIRRRRRRPDVRAMVSTPCQDTAVRKSCVRKSLKLMHAKKGRNYQQQMGSGAVLCKEGQTTWMQIMWNNTSKPGERKKIRVCTRNEARRRSEIRKFARTTKIAHFDVRPHRNVCSYS